MSAPRVRLVTRRGGVRQRVEETLGSWIKELQHYESPRAALDAAPPSAGELWLVDLADRKDGAEAGLELIRRVRERGERVVAVAERQDAEAVLACLRAGASDFAVVPGGEEALRAAVRRALRSVAVRSEGGEIVAVMSACGGLGATQLAINLADRLQGLTWRRVLLLDLDLYLGGVGPALDVEGYGVFDLLRDGGRLDEELLLAQLPRACERFHVAALPREVGDAEAVDPAELTALLTTLRAHFGSLVLDLAHDFAPVTRAALGAADRVLLLTPQGVPGVRRTQAALRLLDALGVPSAHVELVLARADHRRELEAEDLARALARPIAGVLPEDAEAVRRAELARAPLAEVAPTSALARAVEDIARSLAGLPEAAGRGRVWRGLTGLLPLRGVR